MLSMDKELTALLTKYKACLEKNFQTNNETKEEITVDQPTTSNDETTEKITESLEKVQLRSDTTPDMNDSAVSAAKLDIQHHIDNALWNCACRTTLRPTQETDKLQLLKMIETLFETEKRIYSTENDGEAMDEFYKELHEWILQVATIYVTVYKHIRDREKILLFLIDTPHIMWAVPLIQLDPENDIMGVSTYTDILSQVLEKAVWTEEDDYFAVLDQLAIDHTYHSLWNSYQSLSDKNETEDNEMFDITKHLIDVLYTSTKRFHSMNSLTKRLCQIVVRICQIFVDGMGSDQDQIDALLLDVIDVFRTSENCTVWAFFSQFPTRSLSTQALWELSLKLLCLNEFPEPASLEEVLESPPNIDLFKGFLEEDPIRGTYVLSCLTDISTSIPSGVDQLPQHDINATCALVIVSLSLFQVAFVDKNLRKTYYKDVTDHFELVCQHHPFVTSLLLRWTVENMKSMQNMALYLFHSVPIHKWTILSSDLKRLHQIILSESIVDVQLAKYIIENLNYGYAFSVDTVISKSQPWHSRRKPFMGYDIHEDLAFLILDACQKFQPLSDSNKGAIDMMTSAVVSNYITTNTGSEFIQWSWKIVQKLKLYDCPVSTRAADIESSLTIVFIRNVLNSYNDASASHSALVIYVSLMLSATSRHFLRFESGKGWLKLLTILKRGKPEAVVQVMSEMIPSFVYMHGDDLFNDPSLSDFLKHVFLTKVQMEPIIGANLWQAQLIDDSVMEQGSGFSYVDLMFHCWLKTVFRKNDWVSQKSMVAIMNNLCKLAFILKRRKLIHPMLMEEYKHLERQKAQQEHPYPNSDESNGPPKIARFLKNMVYESTMAPTLLVSNDEWFGIKGVSRSPGVNHQHIWFVFESLVVETIAENPYRQELLSENPKQPRRSPDFFSIYRWIQHILVIPMDHPLLPLFFQCFFCLYYQRLDSITTLGSILLNKKPELLSKLRDYTASVQTYFSQKMVLSPDMSEQFQQIYYAMWLWLGNQELLKTGYDIDQLPPHYHVDRLKQCYSNEEDAQPWHDESRYWMDLVDRSRLLQEFMQYPWEASERFRTKNKAEDCSSSLRSKRSRMTACEPTIAPLPDICFNDPNKTT